ncbi:MAG: hypothetical protein FK733_01675 [Asgard group archaeon]|nr:hypothetical protein [Asgard group archaeon]
MSDKEITVGPRFFVGKNRVVNYLKNAEAFSEKTAQSLVDSKIVNLTRVVSTLLEEEVIDHTSEGHYYLRLEALDAFDNQRKKFMFILVTSIVIPAVLFLLLGIAWILTAT